jgi:nitrogen-specific signal transduction histidine kinase/CheY-like chemotaxis protein
MAIPVPRDNAFSVHDPEVERPVTEALEQQARHLESLGMLVGGIAHDFNNLLAVITSFGTFVAEEIVKAERDGCDHLDTAGGDIEKVLRAARRGVGLTKQLLAFGHRQVVNAEVVDVNAVIRRFAELLTPTLGMRIGVVLNLAPKPHPVLVDPAQLERALLNLAANARGAMPDGGALSIDTANIVVGAGSTQVRAGAHEGPHVRIRVSDTGCAIPSELISKVFEPFSTTSDECSGTDLGLATVHSIVTRAGGIVEVHSDASASTVFTMLFPATGDLPGAASGRAPESVVVLVVEDDEALREITRRIFTRNGYQVLTASNGPDAIKVAERCEGEIHLLLTDVVMPGMPGMEVAAKIQAIQPGISVLYMSGYARPVLADQGRLDPDIVLLEKPFSEAEIMRKVGQVLDGAHLEFHGGTSRLRSPEPSLRKPHGPRR